MSFTLRIMAPWALSLVVAVSVAGLTPAAAWAQPGPASVAPAQAAPAQVRQPSPTAKGPDAPVSALIVEYGTVTARDTGQREEAPGTLAGHTKLVEDPRVVQRTRHVCAELGKSFGIWFEVRTKSGRLPTEVTIRTTYPTITAPSGRSSQEGLVTARVTSNPHYIGWTFDDPWELVAGRWRIAITSGDAVLAEQSFDVTVGQCDAVS